MATIVLCHGAWSAAWAWRRMRPLFADAGHVFHAPTCTGLGERAHLAGPDVDLETHIADILGVIETEELTGITLLGHSYGGMVATGVADRVRDRVEKLVYLDAFVPADGQSWWDLAGDQFRCLGPGDEYSADDHISLSNQFTDQSRAAHHRKAIFRHDLGQIAQPVKVHIEEIDLCSQTTGHLGRIGADHPAAKDKNGCRPDPGYAA